MGLGAFEWEARVMIGRSHQRAVGWIVLIGVVLGFGRILMRPAGVPEAGVGTGSGGGVPIRLDPNTATLAELQAVPGMGDARAKAIVAYRTERERAGETRVFRSPADLDKVRGFGEATIRSVSPYLGFPEQ